MAPEEKDLKPKKSHHTEQINRSLGYLISIAGNADDLYKSLSDAEPLLNKKILRRLAAVLHVVHKIKAGKSPNENPQN